MDKNYWKNYYEKQVAPIEASLFAQYALGNCIKDGDSLLELGCGNGRDSIFFANNGVTVVAVDQCENEISTLSKEQKLSNLKFLTGDFTKLGEIGKFNHIYSRFTLHSITEKEESDTIKWAYEHLEDGDGLLIEARGKKNELYKLGTPVSGEPDAYIYEGHFRRFVDIEILCNKLIQAGFNIAFAEEKSGFAPFDETDYHFIRIIAVKK